MSTLPRKPSLLKLPPPPSTDSPGLYTKQSRSGAEFAESQARRKRSSSSSVCSSSASSVTSIGTSNGTSNSASSNPFRSSNTAPTIAEVTTAISKLTIDCQNPSSTSSASPQRSSSTPSSFQQASDVPVIDDVVPDVQFRHGDWVCPSYKCSYHNFARNSSCNQCGTHKPNGLTAAASSSIAVAAASSGGSLSLLGTRLEGAAAGLARSSDGQVFIDGLLKRCQPPSNLPPRLRKLAEMNSDASPHILPTLLALDGHQLSASPPSLTPLPQRSMPAHVDEMVDLDNSVKTPTRAKSTHFTVSPSAAVFHPASTPFATSSASQFSSSSATDPKESTSITTPSGSSQASLHSDIPAMVSPLTPAEMDLTTSVYRSTPAPASLSLSSLLSTSSSSWPTASFGFSTPGYMAPTHSTFLHLYQRGIEIGAGANPKPQLANGQGPPIKNTGNVGPMQPQPGDWWCCLCGFTNWRRRRYCMKCFPCADQDPHSTAIKASICLANYLAAAPPNSPMLLHLQKQAALGCNSDQISYSSSSSSKSKNTNTNAPRYMSMPMKTTSTFHSQPQTPAVHGSHSAAAAASARPLSHSYSYGYLSSSSPSSVSTPSTSMSLSMTPAGEKEGFPFFPATSTSSTGSMYRQTSHSYSTVPSSTFFPRKMVPSTSLSSMPQQQQPPLQGQNEFTKASSCDRGPLSRSSSQPLVAKGKASLPFLIDEDKSTISNHRDIWNGSSGGSSASSSLSSTTTTAPLINISDNLSTSPWPSLSSSPPSPRPTYLLSSPSFADGGMQPSSSSPASSPMTRSCSAQEAAEGGGYISGETSRVQSESCNEDDHSDESSASAAIWRNAPIGTVPLRSSTPDRASVTERHLSLKAQPSQSSLRTRPSSSSLTTPSPYFSTPSSSSSLHLHAFEEALASPWTFNFDQRKVPLPLSPNRSAGEVPSSLAQLSSSPTSTHTKASLPDTLQQQSSHLDS